MPFSDSELELHGLGPPVCLSVSRSGKISFTGSDKGTGKVMIFNLLDSFQHF